MVPGRRDNTSDEPDEVGTRYEYSVVVLPTQAGDDDPWVIRRAEGAKSWEGVAAAVDPERAHEVATDLNLAQSVRPKVSHIGQTKRRRSKAK